LLGPAAPQAGKHGNRTQWPLTRRQRTVCRRRRRGSATRRILRYLPAGQNSGSPLALCDLVGKVIGI
jgi:hypothetical protein